VPGRDGPGECVSGEGGMEREVERGRGERGDEWG